MKVNDTMSDYNKYLPFACAGGIAVIRRQNYCARQLLWTIKLEIQSSEL